MRRNYSRILSDTRSRIGLCMCTQSRRTAGHCSRMFSIISHIAERDNVSKCTQLNENIFLAYLSLAEIAIFVLLFPNKMAMLDSNNIRGRYMESHFWDIVVLYSVEVFTILLKADGKFRDQRNCARDLLVFQALYSALLHTDHACRLSCLSQSHCFRSLPALPLDSRVRPVNSL